MSRILGLDLGENSIGWAIIKDNEIESTVMNTLSDSKHNNFNKSTSLLERIIIGLKLNYKTVFLYLITLLMFSFSIIFPSNWQFWINIGIGSLIATLTFNK